MRRILSLIAALAVSVAVVPAELVVNGSFEDPIIGGQGQTFYGGITGWTISGSIDILRNYWENADGLQSIDLSGLEAGSISQWIPTEVGGSYVLSYSMAGNPDGGIKQMVVLWGGSVLETNTFDTAGQSIGNMGWLDYQHVVTSSSNFTQLQFVSLTVGNAGPALDSVSLVIPEASSAMWLGLALTFLILRGRRLTRK
ncbi:MAG TPA: DUF642 domain-containing protein [Verrucomicrobiae bacterium]|nr:DUF642 domain-containing protein [Verrucomicrobiae bacterium]